MNSSDLLRIAAIGDVHCSKQSFGRLSPIFTQAARDADVLLLCGDLTDYGLPEEAHIFVNELAAARGMPVLAVLGNHDFESARQHDVAAILTDGGITLLDGEAHEIYGVSFIGTKGFGGGFGEHALQPWGEDAMKTFVKAALDEALKLESGLAKCRTEGRIVLLHYAPILQTVEGEPREIYPFLGSSRLEEPINRYAATVVFHGHAHHGTPEGKTKTGIPVYNVSMPLLRRLYPEQPPMRIWTLPRPALTGNFPI